ncbi:MAG: hypothetical protein M5R36_03445 [Deltaproteobacteria bacterium]|nr:hypothetical protein [Deltaproteobacteria bacterium]
MAIVSALETGHFHIRGLFVSRAQRPAQLSGLSDHVGRRRNVGGVDSGDAGFSPSGPEGERVTAVVLAILFSRASRDSRRPSRCIPYG